MINALNIHRCLLIVRLNIQAAPWGVLKISSVLQEKQHKVSAPEDAESCSVPWVSCPHLAAHVRLCPLQDWDWEATRWRAHKSLENKTLSHCNGHAVNFGHFRKAHNVKLSPLLTMSPLVIRGGTFWACLLLLLISPLELRGVLWGGSL